jgi:hypothetical protein
MPAHIPIFASPARSIFSAEFFLLNVYFIFVGNFRETLSIPNHKGSSEDGHW